MTTLCFRCDWQGRAIGTACPSCGAPLQRIETPRPSRAIRDAALDPDEPDLGPEPALRPRLTRSGPTALLGPIASVTVIVLLVLAAIEAVSADDAPPNGPGQPAGADDGRLVYVTTAEGGGQLWVLDLATGDAVPGPTVSPTTVELVDASAAGTGRIGVERRDEAGTVRVSVLHGLSPDVGVERLARGDLVAWGPGGASLVAVRHGARSGGCSPVRITLVMVRTGEIGWELRDPGMCGPFVSLSRSAAATYFTTRSGDRAGVYLTGDVGVPHLLFEDVAMVSASPLGSFLLRGVDGGSAHGATSLGWKGIGGPVSIGRGDLDLVVERVLAWAPDGSRVAVLGALGSSRGVFVVEAGSGSRQRVPEFVEIDGEAMDATFDARGSLYLVAGDELFVYRAGTVTSVPIPDGVPSPSGPIVWIA